MIDGSESDTWLHQRSDATINDASMMLRGFINEEDQTDQIDREIVLRGATCEDIPTD